MHTQVVIMITVVVVMVVVIQRRLLATSQGRGAFGDLTDRQTNRHTAYNIQHIFFLFISIYFYILSLFETLGCI